MAGQADEREVERMVQEARLHSTLAGRHVRRHHEVDSDRATRIDGARLSVRDERDCVPCGKPRGKTPHVGRQGGTYGGTDVHEGVNGQSEG